MNYLIKILFSVLVTFGYAGNALSQDSAGQHELYREEFRKKVYLFGNFNKFNIGNVNRDKYINCYMAVGIEVTINTHGAVSNMIIKEPSPVSAINKYFGYIVKQSAPFKPLSDYFGKKQKSITFMETFRLNLNLYEKSKITKPCR